MRTFPLRIGTPTAAFDGGGAAHVLPQPLSGACWQSWARTELQLLVPLLEWARPM